MFKREQSMRLLLGILSAVGTLGCGHGLKAMSPAIWGVQGRLISLVSKYLTPDSPSDSALFAPSSD